ARECNHNCTATAGPPSDTASEKGGLSPDEYTRGGGAADARFSSTAPRDPSHCDVPETMSRKQREATSAGEYMHAPRGVSSDALNKVRTCSGGSRLSSRPLPHPPECRP